MQSTKKIDVTESVIEAEKAATKLRWRQQLKNVTDEHQTFYQRNNNSFVLKRAKAMDLPFNTRVQMPQPHSQEIETKIRYAKVKIRHIVTNYTATHKGSENVDRETKTGIKQLHKRIKEGNIIIYPTDSSGRLRVDTHDNYRVYE